ncbi:unnamed protein product [Effrenium voratum]|nr:unnamed protein product [Effrenium voratum]
MKRPGGRCLLLLGLLLGYGRPTHRFTAFAGWFAPAGREVTARNAGDDEVAALLAQAQALREEVQREEATRERTLPISTENAMSSQDAMRARRAEEQAAEAEVEEAAPSPVPGEDPVVAKARAELAAAKAALEAAKREAGSPGTAPKPAAAAAPTPAPATTALEDVQLNFSGQVMTEAEWKDLAEKFLDMNLVEQFQTNSRVGPQGRRKLKALREGKQGAFILPGERVRLLKDDNAFRGAFKRFPAQSLNGYTAEKWTRRGEECIIEKVFNDKTLTCVFADSTRFDLPWEVVDGYKE